MPGVMSAQHAHLPLPAPLPSADLGLMNLGDLFPTFPTQALSEGGASGAGGQVGAHRKALHAPTWPCGASTSRLLAGVRQVMPTP